jgi:putative nucleotidyltransferase with HDIG domain
MWPLKRKSSPRRLDGRKGLPGTEVSRWQRLRDSGGVVPLILVMVFYAGALLMNVIPLEPLPYRVGQYVPADIYARVGFSVPSERNLLEKIIDVPKNTPPTFQLNASFVDEIVATLKNLPASLKATSQPAQIPDALRKDFGIVNGQDLETWKSYSEGPASEKLAGQLDRLRMDLSQTCIVRPDDFAQIGQAATEVLLVTPQGKVSRDRRTVITLGDKEGVGKAADRMAEFFDPPIRPNVRSYLTAALGRGQPLFVYDMAATQKDIDARKRELEQNPPLDTFDSKKAGGVLAQASRRGTPEKPEAVGLSAEALDLLRREHRAYLDQEYRDHPWLLVGRAVGRAGLLLIVTILLCLDLLRNQSQLVRDLWRALALVASLLAMLGMAKGIASVQIASIYLVLLPVLMGAMIATVAFDQRFALVVGVLLSVFVVLQLRLSFVTLLVFLAGVAACVFQLREIRTRSKLLRVSAVAAVFVFAAVWMAELSSATPAKFMLVDGLWAAGATLLAGILVQVFLPAIEWAFRVATSMTLLEWCDASKPLLRRLAMEAPGTYNHSLQLGTICETAAEVIGARGLVARVGAYYHDIGKTNKPDYFVENEGGSASRHARLSPAMSLLIILGHVKDGLELAREYGLPRMLHEFITTHHGTTLVQYFYHAAAEQRRGDSERAPEEFEFRYPGPKPHTKEAAILMLADAAESSVRAMPEPTPGRIENQVHTMINRRLMDGQLDECDVTLREVHLIETSIIKSIAGIYHSRIAYPTPPGQRPSAGELLAARREEALLADRAKKAEEVEKAEKAQAAAVAEAKPAEPAPPT